MIGEPQKKALEESILRRNVLVEEVSEAFEIRAGGTGESLSTSHRHTFCGSKAPALGSGTRGRRIGGGGGAPATLRTLKSGSPLPALHSKQQGRGSGEARGSQPLGMGAARLGCLSLTLNPRNKKLRKKDI